MKKMLLTVALFFVLLSTLCFSATAVENVTFDTVEGDSAAIYSENKEITVNVFGRTTCGNTIATLKEILANGIDKDKTVKINFIDVDMKSKEDVLNFRNGGNFSDYPQNGISFSYCTGTYANNFMWYLLEADGNNSSSVTLPVIAYIDKEGKLIKTTTGPQDANDLYRIIYNKDIIKEEISFSVTGTENYDYAFEVLKQLNELRASKGLSALTMDDELLDVAMQRAAECAIYYSHTRPDGSRCTTAFQSGGYLGENIAIGQISPTAVMTDWTNSEGHYQNMINPSFKSVGIGAFKASDGTLCWVQFLYGGSRQNTTQKISSKEVTRQIKATVDKLDLSIGFSSETDIILLSKGERADLEIINTNCGWPYTTQHLSLSDFNIISTDESLLSVDEKGIALINKEPPFEASVKIVSKSNPAVYFNTSFTAGHVHTYSEHTSYYEAACGYKRTTVIYTCYECDHSYSEITETGSHNFSKEEITEAATKDKDGTITVRCSGCTEIKETKSIAKIDKTTISETQYTYNGKNKAPVITIKDSKENILKEGIDYYINGKDDLVSAGIHNVTVYFEGKYEGYHIFKIYIHPATPAGLTLKSTAKTVTAKWKNAKGADSYKVELLRNGKAYKTDTTSATTVKFEKHSKNTKYTVRVTALSAYDSLSSLKSISSDTATVSAPVLKVKAQKKKASLSWDKVKNASGYVIYMATAKNGKYKKVTAVKGGTLKYTKKKLKTNKKYYFKIKAYRTIGKKNIYSSYSSVKSVKIK